MLYRMQSHCQANLYGIGRNESLFRNATMFAPQRWLTDEQGEGRRLRTLASLNFGHGPRMCLGKQLRSAVHFTNAWWLKN